MKKINLPEQFFGVWWKRVGITTLIVHLASYFVVVGIISGFATFLSFEDYDYPDQRIVDQFVEIYVPIISQVCLLVFSFFGAVNVVRNVKDAPLKNSLALGILVVSIHFFFRWPGSVNSEIITTLLILGLCFLLGLPTGDNPSARA